MVLDAITNARPGSEIGAVVEIRRVVVRITSPVAV